MWGGGGSRGRRSTAGRAPTPSLLLLLRTASRIRMQPNLFTEVSTSLERSFAAAEFIDSPGLVDGDMK